MRKLLALALVAVLALAATAFAATHTYKVGDVYFVKRGKPQTVSVHKGDTVRWHWVGKLPHNVTVIKGPVKFHSKTQTSGNFSKRLTRKGTYVLMCTVHGGNQKMTIRVR